MQMWKKNCQFGEKYLSVYGLCFSPEVGGNDNFFSSLQKSNTSMCVCLYTHNTVYAVVVIIRLKLPSCVLQIKYNAQSQLS